MAEQEIEDLRLRCQILGDRAAGDEEALAQLRSEAAAARAEATAETARCAAMEQRLTESLYTFGSAQDEVASLVSRLQAAEEADAASLARVAGLEADLAQVTADRDRLATDLQAANEDRAAQVGALEGEAALMAARLEAAEAALLTAQAEYETVAAEATRLESELEQNRGRQSEIGGDLAEATLRLEAAESAGEATARVTSDRIRGYIDQVNYICNAELVEIIVGLRSAETEADARTADLAAEVDRLTAALAETTSSGVAEREALEARLNRDHAAAFETLEQGHKATVEELMARSRDALESCEAESRAAAADLLAELDAAAAERDYLADMVRRLQVHVRDRVDLVDRAASVGSSLAASAENLEAGLEAKTAMLADVRGQYNDMVAALMSPRPVSAPAQPATVVREVPVVRESVKVVEVPTYLPAPEPVMAFGLAQADAEQASGRNGGRRRYFTNSSESSGQEAARHSPTPPPEPQVIVKEVEVRVPLVTEKVRVVHVPAAPAAPGPPVVVDDSGAVAAVSANLRAEQEAHRREVADNKAQVMSVVDVFHRDLAAERAGRASAQASEAAVRRFATARIADHRTVVAGAATGLAEELGRAVQGLQRDLDAERAERAALATEVDRLTSVNAAYKARIQEVNSLFDDKVGALEGDIARVTRDAEARISSAVEDADRATAQVAATEAELQRVRDHEVPALQAQVADLREQAAAEDAALAALGAERDALARNVRTEEARVAGLEREKANLSARLAQETAHAAAIRVEKEMMAQRLATEEDEIAALEADRVALREQLARDEAALETVAAERLRLEGRVVHDEDELRALERERAALTAKVAAEEAHLQAAVDERQALADKLRADDAELAAALEAKRDLAARLEKEDAVVAGLLADKQAMAAELREDEACLAVLVAEKEALAAQLRDNDAALQAKLEAYEAQIRARVDADFLAERASLEADRQRLASAQDAVASAAAAAEEARVAAEQRADALANKANSLEAERARVTAERQRLDAERDRIASEEEALKAEHRAVKAEHDEVEGEEAELAVKMAALAAEARRLTDERAAVEAAEAQLSNDHAAVVAEEAQLEAQRAALAADRALLEKEAAALAADRAALAAEHRGIESEHAALAAEHAAIEAEHTSLDVKRRQLFFAVDGLKLELEAAKRELESVSAEFAPLERQLRFSQSVASQSVASQSALSLGPGSVDDGDSTEAGVEEGGDESQLVNGVLQARARVVVAEAMRLRTALGREAETKHKLEGQIKALNDQYSARLSGLTQELSAGLDAARGETLRLQDEELALEDRLAAVEAEADAPHHANDDLEAHSQRLIDQLNHLAQALEEVRSDRDAAEGALADLRLRLGDREGGHIALLQNQVHGVVRDLIGRCVALEARVTELKAWRAEDEATYAAEVEDLSQQLLAAQRQCALLEARAGVGAASVDGYAERVGEAEAQLLAMMASLKVWESDQALLRDIDDVRWTNRMRALEDENDALRSALADARAGLDAAAGAGDSFASWSDDDGGDSAQQALVAADAAKAAAEQVAAAAKETRREVTATYLDGLVKVQHGLYGLVAQGDVIFARRTDRLEAATAALRDGNGGGDDVDAGDVVAVAAAPVAPLTAAPLSFEVDATVRGYREALERSERVVQVLVDQLVALESRVGGEEGTTPGVAASAEAALASPQRLGDFEALVDSITLRLTEAAASAASAATMAAPTALNSDGMLTEAEAKAEADTAAAAAARAERFRSQLRVGDYLVAMEAIQLKSSHFFDMVEGMYEERLAFKTRIRDLNDDAVLNRTWATSDSFIGGAGGGSSRLGRRVWADDDAADASVSAMSSAL